MITYRKKSLKVHIIHGSEAIGQEKFTHYIARKIKEFIETGNYSRIADVKIYGAQANSTQQLVCTIIYEESANNSEQKQGGSV